MSGRMIVSHGNHITKLFGFCQGVSPLIKAEPLMLCGYKKIDLACRLVDLPKSAFHGVIMPPIITGNGCQQ